MKGKENSLFNELGPTPNGYAAIMDEQDYRAMAAEVRAGNYVLLDERQKTGGKDGKFYFNKLTSEGELVATGKNGYGLPAFTLKNATNIHTEDLLPALVAAHK